MARMRTIKPEFWADDVIADLSRDARLLFMATWNAADDEGILRWNAAYLKAAAFMYDDDLGAAEVAVLMSELVEADLIFPYHGAGKSHQHLALIIKFHRHQKINRPQASKLTPPSLQNPAVAQMYARRDAWTCHICNGPIEWTTTNRAKILSLDHAYPQSRGGSDYPSNIKAAHFGCNAGKRDTIPDDSMNDSLNPTLIDPEQIIDGKGIGKGRGEVGEGNGVETTAQKRGTRLPDDWKPSANDREWTLKRIDAASAAIELEKFRNHWIAKTGKDATKLEWGRTWRNWILNVRGGSSPGRASPTGSTADQRVAEGMAVAARLRQQEHREIPA